MPQILTARFQREMSISREEFLRLLPKALAGMDFSVDGREIRATAGPRGVLIRLSPERQRRAAMIMLPVIHVEITLEGFSESQSDGFMRQFELAYQRGGG
jgi:hypothetical protein